MQQAWLTGMGANQGVVCARPDACGSGCAVNCVRGFAAAPSGCGCTAFPAVVLRAQVQRYLQTQSPPYITPHVGAPGKSVPLPATVVMIPSGLTLRMRKLPVSAM